MSRQLTIEGRFVQGGLTMHPQKDMKTGQPKKDSEGKPVLGNFIAIAIPKKINVNGQWVDNPKVGEYYAQFDAEARLNFPHLYTTGQNSHPRFAMKWQDGDGVDSNGKSVADVPGFAGHWIIKCATQLRAPNCYVRNSAGGLDQLTEPEKVIKKGYYVAVAITIDGNGVEPGNAQAVPGLFVTPEQVLFVAPGEEIFTGIDPNQAFAGIAGAQAPAGAAAVGGLSSPPLPSGAPPMPGNAALPSPGVASSAPVPGGNAPMPGAAAVPTGAPPLPGGVPVPGSNFPTPGAAPTPAQPVYQMTASAQGATREQLLAMGVGWTDEKLIEAGHMIRVS